MFIRLNRVGYDTDVIVNTEDISYFDESLKGHVGCTVFMKSRLEIHVKNDFAEIEKALDSGGLYHFAPEGE